jgi:predicted transposase YdaD
MLQQTDADTIQLRFLETAKAVTELYIERNKLKENYKDIITLLDYQQCLVEIGHKLVKAKYLARELMVFYANKAREEYTHAMIEKEKEGKQSTYAKSYASESSNISTYESEKWEINYKKFRDMWEAIKNDQISIHSRYKYIMGVDKD